MRKMMMVASLVSAAACGAVEEPAVMNDEGSGSDSDTGSGSDAGSGSGSGSGDGSGSDTEPQPAGSLTIDPSNFVVDNDVWWTSTTSPTLHGTFDAPTGAAVAVKIGAVTFPATLTNNSWAVALPTNTISSSSVAITAVLTAPSGTPVQEHRTLGLDSAPPSISVQGSAVRDERGDTIDFSTGEPIHTHAGATIDLAATGCPSVYKYAYLMDASTAFGSSTSPNDLAWKIRVTDAKLQVGSQQFRVRTDTGSVLVAWTALPTPDAAGYATVKLTRSGGSYPIASLGTRTGQFFIDVRATDWANLSTTSSFCFDHHPLAAPLKVTAFEGGSLFNTTIDQDSSIVAIMNGNTALVAKQRIVQQTAEPVTVSWSVSSSKPSFTSTTAYGYVEEKSYANWLCPSGNTKPECAMATPPTNMGPIAATSTSGVMPASFSATVRDDVTGEVITTGTPTATWSGSEILFSAPVVTFTIPARGANEAPRSYTIEITHTGTGQFGLPIRQDWTPFGSYSLLGLPYAGNAPNDLRGTQCLKIVNSAFGPMCSEAIKYWSISAVDRVVVSFNAFVATLTTGIDSQHQTAPDYLPASTLTSAPMNWDSGDNDLPGPL